VLKSIPGSRLLLKYKNGYGQALWMGVPLVSLAGHTFISRMTGSILHQAGLADPAATVPAVHADSKSRKRIRAKDLGPSCPLSSVLRTVGAAC
jgi:hypothetical protein